MVLKPWVRFFLLIACFALALLPLACGGSKGGNAITSPAGSGNNSSQATNTFSPTQTLTPTITNTPDCLDATPIATTSINGPDIHGNDTGDTPPMNLEGTGPNGDLYSFTLTSTTTLSFSLCPTEDESRDTYMILRAGHCWNQSGEYTNDDACDYLSELTNLSLGAGTYYLLITENGGDGPAPYILRVRSGTISGPVYTVTSTATATAVPSGEQLNCSVARDLGAGSPLPTGETIVTGQLDDVVNTDDYYMVEPANSGTVTITLDGYDNGLNQADFDLYLNSGCSGTTDTGFITSSTTVGATSQQITFTATGGTGYFIDVYAAFGAGTYRLTVQTP